MKKIAQFSPMWALSVLLILGACSSSEDTSDAFGTFEATEVTVSAEANGKLNWFTIEEGTTVKKGQQIGVVDTTQLVLTIKQLEAKRAAIGSRTTNVVAQLDVLKSEVAVLEIERKRIQSLLKAEAATQKQLDDIDGRLSVARAKRGSIQSQNAPVAKEIAAIDAQIEQIRDQIQKAVLINPIEGTVMVKLAEPSEIVNYGRPLYRIAPLDSLYLRAYLTGSQLASVQLGQTVEVLIDKGAEEFYTYPGTVTWISSQAEFTPKIVQTKEERVNLVYAFKVKVKNDGKLKIGMPGEVRFSNQVATAEPSAE